MTSATVSNGTVLADRDMVAAASQKRRAPRPEATLRGLRVTFLVGTLGNGGAERQLFHVADTLKKAGAFPVVLSLAAGEYWEAGLREAGVPVEWVGQRHSKLGRLLDVRRAFKRHAPHVVQSFHFYTNLYAAVAARSLGLPNIGAVRNDGLFDMADVGVLGPAALRLPQLVVANSQAAIDTLGGARVPARRLRLLSNVIDTSWFTPRIASDSATFDIVAIGRLAPEKRFDRMLRIVADLRSRTARMPHLTIVGEGRLGGELRALAVALGVDGCVTFAGSQSDVRPFLARAACLLLTSDAEGTPNVILEAMASGRAVVASNVGGVGNLVADGRNGFLLPPTNEVAFCQTLRTLADDPSLAARLGQEGRRIVEVEYALERLPKRLAELYAVVLNRTTPTL